MFVCDSVKLLEGIRLMWREYILSPWYSCSFVTNILPLAMGAFDQSATHQKNTEFYNKSAQPNIFLIFFQTRQRRNFNILEDGYRKEMKIKISLHSLYFWYLFSTLLQNHFFLFLNWNICQSETTNWNLNENQKIRRKEKNFSLYYRF